MLNPYLITEPTCISFSGGRTSAYMLYQILQAHDGVLPEDAIVCFANTGKEAEETLRFVQDCSEHWNVHINWVEYRVGQKFELVNFETASRNGEPFEALIRKKNYLPNPVARFCTEELKVKPIKAFSGLADDQTMIGVRADEPIRISKLRARGLILPLVTARVSKLNVRMFWKSSPFDLQLEEHDGITPDGNCDLCFLKDARLTVSSIAKTPNKGIWWAKQEEYVGATFRKDRPSYAEMMRFTADQSDMFADETIDCFCGD